VDATLRLNQTRPRWPDGPPKDRHRPAGTSPALVPKDGAPRESTHAWIAAIPHLSSPEPHRRRIRPAAPGTRFWPAQAERRPRAHAPLVPRWWPELAQTCTAAPACDARAARTGRLARALRLVVAKLNDDREWTGVKIGVLGLVLLVTAALERIWG